MADPYTDVSVSSYNANPPPDDGSETDANEVTWTKHKTKLGDPLKTAIEALNTNIGAMVDKLLDGAGVTTDGAGATLAAGNQGKLVRQTASGITTTTPDATSVGSPFVLAIVNDGGGANTIEGNGSQTINGEANISLQDRQGIILFTDGSNWFTVGFPTSIVAGQISASAVTQSKVGPGIATGLITVEMANGTDATNDIDFTTGVVRDSTDAVTAIYSSALTKRLDEDWAAGTNAGMRNSAAVIANTTYHIYSVSKALGADPEYYAYATVSAEEPAVSDVLTALQAETDGSDYIYARRVGSILRESAAIVPFSQNGDEFLRDVPINDETNNDPGTSEVLVTVSVPTGIQVNALVSLGIEVERASSFDRAASILLTSPDQTDTAPSSTLFDVKARQTASDGLQDLNSVHKAVRTNTAAQVRYRSDSSGTWLDVWITTSGWIDRRGRF